MRGSTPSLVSLGWRRSFRSHFRSWPMISYADLQHGFHFLFYSFRASAVHIMPGEYDRLAF